jgi:heterodisulfide reductase subunit D
MNLEEIVQQTKTYYCLECGKCSSMCPISKYDPKYSPRVMVEEGLLGLQDDLVYNKKLFSCLGCLACQSKCPSDVDYINFIREARGLATAAKQHGDYAHAGAMQSITTIMARPSVKQNRLQWLQNNGCKTKQTGEVMYFVGCAPYIEALMEDIPSQPLIAAAAALKLLNAVGIEPVVSPNEKCCGHDMLWLGEFETFKKLAEHNAAMIKESGVKKIVFSCPEGYRTFKMDYPNVVKLDCEVVHISELLAEKVESGALKFKELKKKVTFQDPCRLGRHMGVFDAPRKVLAAIPGLELIEMPHNREESICCGTSCFTNCDSYSKQIRVDRLSEAKATGAEILVTACPKCQTHFKCAMLNKGEVKGPDLQMEVMDLVNIAANAMGG